MHRVVLPLFRYLELNIRALESNSLKHINFVRTMIRLIILFLTCVFGSLFLSATERDTIDLSGVWQYRLLGAPSSIPGEGIISLPGTLDSQHKSVYNQESDNTSQLRREFSLIGEATYSRTINIPPSWKDKNIYLKLERTKPSAIFIDGEKIDYNSRISSPQKYDLTGYLSPGSHILEVSVNNADSIPPIIARSSHAVSDATQTNWNGILGEILIESIDPHHIKNIRIEENDTLNSVKLTVDYSKAISSGFNVRLNVNDKFIESKKIIPGSYSTEFYLPISHEMLWNASHPVLTKLEFELLDPSGTIIDKYHVTTGFRKLKTQNKYFFLNESPIFLRGTVNAAVFPLTGYAPLDRESWIDYFSTLKDYGINHVRFHSWTPPQAAFQAADELGFYILVELPIWGELDRDLIFHNKFLQEDLKGIMEAYAHHPSFLLFSTGNELWGDISLMGEYMQKAKLLNPRILSTHGSNIYLGMNGENGGEDFLISAKTSEDTDYTVRGSDSFADNRNGGYINSHYPSSNYNFSKATRWIGKPIISHEIGQYQSYPDFSEIEKYKGILKPDNLVEFQKRAREAGTFRQNKLFAESSGKWAAKLYKAEMEAAQRTQGIAGYELFGIQDYPGQGTALVGILDPFMDSKGFISPETWRESSSDTMILAEFPKFCFIQSEYVEIPVLKVNFSNKSDILDTIYWETEFDNGFFKSLNVLGTSEAGRISFKIPELLSPQKFSLNLSSSEGVKNQYDFWAFPRQTEKVSNVTVTDNIEETLELLKKGKNVILCPDSVSISKASIDPLFVTDFWNYRMFRTICDEMGIPPSPGTLGLYVDNTHPALKKFPTSDHTDWQWYSIIKHSRPLIIDRLPKDFDPIIEVIDNMERNERLALLLECKVDKGKLIIFPADLENLEKTPEGRWLMQSLKEYIVSKECKPKLTLTENQVENLLTKPSTSRLIKELKNETYRRF